MSVFSVPLFFHRSYDTYGVCKDEILNVFFCQLPIGTSGYGPSTHVMMFNFFSEYENGNTDT